ncbi:MAG: methylmalonyl-CoA mutase family protein, partial [Thaumarchaeota archaeon]|nr:methylmalonyl-CoA mutase family protein [Nitrososphaerota archaeon]
MPPTSMLNSGGEVYWSKKTRSIAAKRKGKGKLFDQTAMKDIQKGMEQWQRQVLGPWTEKSGEARKDFQTASGIPLKPAYTPDDISDQSYPDLSFPGVYPYTRGVYPSMYRGRLWTMRMFSGFGTPEDTNKRLKLLLEH